MIYRVDYMSAILLAGFLLRIVLSNLSNPFRPRDWLDTYMGEVSTEKAEDGAWIWQPENSPSGPVSLILSCADRR